MEGVEGMKVQGWGGREGQARWESTGDVREGILNERESRGWKWSNMSVETGRVGKGIQREGVDAEKGREGYEGGKKS